MLVMLYAKHAFRSNLPGFVVVVLLVFSLIHYTFVEHLQSLATV